MTEKEAAKKAPKRTAKKAGGEAEVLAKIAGWPEPFRTMGERIHALILRTAPELKPRVWYGMPGYAKDGPVLCFFRVDKYMTFGLNDSANFSVEEGAADKLMPCAWFLAELDEATEARLAEIVRRAVS